MENQSKVIAGSIFSIVAIVCAIIHAFFPLIVIDSITAMLLLVALIPWLGIFFKTLELPGGLKVEYHELQNIGSRAEDVGLISQSQDEVNIDLEKNIFLKWAAENPHLVLIGLRMEIEKALYSLSSKYGIIGTKGTISAVTHELVKDGILPEGTTSIISELLPILNKAAHGGQFDERTIEWALTSGLSIISTLKNMNLKPNNP